MTPRPFPAALALILLAAPVAAQTSPGLFGATPRPAESAGQGSAAASLFPQGDLDAAAGIAVGIEAPSPAPDPAPVAERAPERAPEPAPVIAAVPAPATAPETPVTEDATPEAAEQTATVTEPQAGTGGTEPAPEQAERTTLASAELLPVLRPRQRPEALTLAPEEVAANCLAPNGVGDRDVARNARSFAADPSLCVTEELVSENGVSWKLTVISNTRHKRGPVWAILHDNEDSAFDAGLYSVSRYGGKMVALETGEGRSFRSQDPNRNFGATRSITAPCRDMTAKPAPAFTEALNRHFSRRYPVLTMHSNENGHVGNGGRGHISAARSSATMKGIMASNPQGGLSDEDNAVLTAGLKPFEADAKAQKLAGYLGARGINMIYEHVRPERNDCSFSFHVKLNGLGDYYNIEVEHGRVAEQKAILDVLMAYLGVKPVR